MPAQRPANQRTARAVGLGYACALGFLTVACATAHGQDIFVIPEAGVAPAQRPGMPATAEAFGGPRGAWPRDPSASFDRAATSAWAPASDPSQSVFRAPRPARSSLPVQASASSEERNVRLRFDDDLRLRAGRFVRPFSRLALARWSLPLPARSLTTQHLTRDGQYGERAFGAVLWHTPPEGLQWFASISNTSWEGRRRVHSDGATANGRVVWNTPALSLGFDLAHIRQTDGGGNGRGNALGIDASTHFGRLGVVLDARSGHVLSPEYDRGRAKPLSLGSSALLSYDVPLSRELLLQPVLMGELADADVKSEQDEAARTVAGVNLIRGPVRLSPQLELVRPLGEADRPGRQGPWAVGERAMIWLIAAPN